jgi:protein-tyrosine phosphatase
LAGLRNLRDVGGYATGDGRVTRWRTLFRADALHRLPPASQAELLDQYRIRTVVDLRWPDELLVAPNVFVDSDRVRYRHIPLLEDNPPELELAGFYQHMLDRRAAQIVDVVRSLLESDAVPALIHCAAGKDRTGVTVAVLLAAVGVDRETIANDYALSTECFALPAVDGGDPDDPYAGPQVVACPPDVMLATLDHLERTHGGAEAFLREAGFGPGDMRRLRELLTEPVAEGHVR